MLSSLAAIKSGCFLVRRAIHDTRHHVGLVVRGIAELEAGVIVKLDLVGQATAGLVFRIVGVVVGESDDLGGVPEADGRDADGGLAGGRGGVVFSGHFD